MTAVPTTKKRSTNYVDYKYQLGLSATTSWTVNLTEPSVSVGGGWPGASWPPYRIKPTNHA